MQLNALTWMEEHTSAPAHARIFARDGRTAAASGRVVAYTQSSIVSCGIRQYASGCRASNKRIVSGESEKSLGQLSPG